MTALKRCIFSGLEKTSGHVLMEKKKKKTTYSYACLSKYISNTYKSSVLQVQRILNVLINIPEASCIFHLSNLLLSL